MFGFDGKATSVSTWIIYGVIFLYYLIATVFPIDAIIGKIYPIFGGILLFSAIGVFIGIFVTGMPLINVWDSWAAPVLSLTALTALWAPSPMLITSPTATSCPSSS